MNFLQKLFNIRKQDEPQARAYPLGSLFGFTFDGELEPGALSSTYLYDVDYYKLAERAYTLVATNEFAQILVSRLTEFVVGTGLRLYPQPMKDLLTRKFKINLPNNFTKQIQDIWNLIEEDKNISITKDQNIHSLAKTVYYNGWIAGDVLIIKRVVDGNIELQVVNGLAVRSSSPYAKGSNNKIIDGVEINKNEEPVAYYVIDKDGKEQRIPARDSKGRLISWLVPIGIKRLNTTRAYSRFGVILQKLHKIGQYSNSEIIAAETNSKFAVVVEQEKESSGVNPLKNLPGFSRSIQNDLSNVPVNSTEDKKAVSDFKMNLKRVASALSIFLPKGQKLSSFDTKRPNTNYTAFVDGSMKYICAACEIPFEVALMTFSNNFSASRASLKMFEVILEYVRKNTIVDYFYQIVYSQIFEIACLQGYIQAPKYLELKNDKGFMDNAYTKAKFVGVKIPHIDEVKEVNAVLSKLKGGLSTFEQALETLGISIDFDSLIETRQREEQRIKESGLKFETLFAPDNGGSSDDDTEPDQKRVKN